MNSLPDGMAQLLGEAVCLAFTIGGMIGGMLTLWLTKKD